MSPFDVVAPTSIVTKGTSTEMETPPVCGCCAGGFCCVCVGGGGVCSGKRTSNRPAAATKSASSDTNATKPSSTTAADRRRLHLRGSPLGDDGGRSDHVERRHYYRTEAGKFSDLRRWSAAANFELRPQRFADHHGFGSGVRRTHLWVVCLPG